MVTLKLGFNVAIAEMDKEKQEACASAVAAAGAVDDNLVSITSVKGADGAFGQGGRRLLSAAVTMGFAIQSPTMEEASAAAALLSGKRLNSELAKRTLPEATVVDAARVLGPAEQQAKDGLDEKQQEGLTVTLPVLVIVPVLAVLALAVSYKLYKSGKCNRQIVSEDSCLGPHVESGRGMPSESAAHAAHSTQDSTYRAPTLPSAPSAPTLPPPTLPASPPPVFVAHDIPRAPATLYPVDAETRGSSNATRAAECVVCLSSAKTQLTRPCGHVCMCEACAQTVSSCPLCRADISERIRAYM